MALNGLRMMPLSPSPSLKFRTARFPRYGFKADISDGAFPSIALFKLAPSIRRPISGLPPSFAPVESQTLTPVLCREGALIATPSFGLHSPAPGALAPVGVIVSPSIDAYSAPSEPLVNTFRLPGLAGYTKRLGCAGAPRPPTSGSELSLTVPSRHVALCDSGRPAAACTQFLHHRRWPSPLDYRLGSTKHPTNPLHVGVSFRSLTTVHFRYDLSIC